MRRLPPTGALEAFLAVAQGGGTLKAASEDLNLSISALSRRIQTLETHVGMALFERRHHELRLTDAGMRLLDAVNPLFDGLHAILEDLRVEHEDSLNIGVPPSFASAWLIPRLQRFRDLHPDVALNLDSSGSPIAKLGMSLDAIILFAEEKQHNLDMRELKPQRAFAVAAPGIVDPRSGVRESLSRLPLLLHRGLPQVLPSWLATVGLTDIAPRRIEYYDDGPLMVAAAESGLGIALVLEDMVAFYPGVARLVRPFGERAPTPYSYYLATKSAGGSTRALRWFRDWILAEAARDETKTAAALPQ